jgi:hypothetical protein
LCQYKPVLAFTPDPSGPQWLSYTEHSQGMHPASPPHGNPDQDQATSGQSELHRYISDMQAGGPRAVRLRCTRPFPGDFPGDFLCEHRSTAKTTMNKSTSRSLFSGHHSVEEQIRPSRLLPDNFGKALETHPMESSRTGKSRCAARRAATLCTAGASLETSMVVPPFTAAQRPASAGSVQWRRRRGAMPEAG